MGRQTLKNKRVGEIAYNGQGLSATIVEYNNAKDITVELSNGTRLEHVRYEYFTNGNLFKAIAKAEKSKTDSEAKTEKKDDSKVKTPARHKRTEVEIVGKPKHNKPHDSEKTETVFNEDDTLTEILVHTAQEKVALYTSGAISSGDLLSLLKGATVQKGDIIYKNAVIASEPIEADEKPANVTAKTAAKVKKSTRKTKAKSESTETTEKVFNSTTEESLDTDSKSTPTYNSEALTEVLGSLLPHKPVETYTEEDIFAEVEKETTEKPVSEPVVEPVVEPVSEEKPVDSEKPVPKAERVSKRQPKVNGKIKKSAKTVKVESEDELTSKEVLQLIADKKSAKKSKATPKVTKVSSGTLKKPSKTETQTIEARFSVSEGSVITGSSIDLNNGELIIRINISSK